jgi:hypothetical protein
MKRYITERDNSDYLFEMAESREIEKLCEQYEKEYDQLWYLFSLVFRDAYKNKKK